VGQIREQGFDVPIILLIAALPDDANVIARVARVTVSTRLHATGGAALLRRVATTTAKPAPSGVEVYAGDDNCDLWRLSLVSELRTATDRGQMAMHLQLKAAFANGQLNGVEVLLRWLLSDREPISPGS